MRRGLEGPLADHALVGHDADRPEVASRVDRLVADRLLRAHVRGRADDPAGAGHGRAAIVEGAGELFAIPKSITLASSSSSFRVRKMLPGLRSRWTMPSSWASPIARAMWVMIRAVSAYGRIRTRSRRSSERLAFEQLHRHERDVAVVDAELEDLDDVRAPECGGRLGLAEEARDDLGPVLVRLEELRVDHLHRDGGAEHDVLGAPHLAHPAFAEAVEEPVLARKHRAGPDSLWGASGHLNGRRAGVSKRRRTLPALRPAPHQVPA